MDNFNTDFKKTFEDDYKVDIPQEFEWENMSSGIYSKMESSRFKNDIVPFLILSCLVIVLSLIYFISHIYTPSQNEMIVNNLSKINHEALTPKTVINEKNTTLHQASINTKRNETINTFSEIESMDVQYKEKIDINHFGNADYVDEKTSYSQPQQNTSSQNPLPHTYIAIPSLITKNTGFLESIRLLDISLTKVKIPFNEVSSKRYRSIGLMTGVNQLFGKLSSPANNHSYFKWLPGYELGINFRIPLTNSLTLYSGISHNLYVQNFEFYNIDSIEVIQKDVVTHIITNIHTNTRNEVTSTISSLVQRERIYNTYNTFRTTSLFISLGKYIHSKNKLNIHLSAGGMYTFATRSKGYGLDIDNEIRNYTIKSNDIYKNQNWNIIGEFSIGYKLSTKFELEGSIRFSKSLTNWSLDPAYTLKPHILNLGIGIRYRL